jgi:hypothetical protein
VQTAVVKNAFYRVGQGALWMSLWNHGGGCPKKFRNHCIKSTDVNFGKTDPNGKASTHRKSKAFATSTKKTDGCTAEKSCARLKTEEKGSFLWDIVIIISTVCSHRLLLFIVLNGILTLAPGFKDL